MFAQVKALVKSREKRARAKQRAKERLKAQIDYYDFNLVAVVLLLTCFGLVILYSTSAYVAELKFGNDMAYFGKQALISVVSILFALLLSRLNYHLLIPLASYVYLAAVVLMVLVKSPLGITVNGARRWLKIGPVQFQPSEVAKIAVITFIPLLIIKMGKQIKTWKACAMLLCAGGFLGALAYIFTDNLSTGIIIVGITVIMIFIAHPRTKPFLIAGAGGAALIVLGVTVLAKTLETSESFRIRRVLVWLEPEKYISDGGYQIMQALYAIGSGGFFGKGLGNSAQKLGAVPEAQNDMIFSIICEELGVFGGAVVLLLFAYLLYRLLFIAQNAPDLYGSLIVCGIFGHIALQVILNICVVINLIPTTGITLPFISYGGTSIIFLMAEIGIALSVSRQIKFQKQEE
jgi:cell division protein FtsW